MLKRFLSTYDFGKGARWSPAFWLYMHSDALRILFVPYMAMCLLIMAWSLRISAILSAAGIGLALFLFYFTCNARNLTKLTFVPFQTRNVRLYYKGSLPILEMNSEGTPFQNGEVHGYRLGQHIESIRSKMGIVLHRVMRQTRARDLHPVLTKIDRYVPEHIREEMKGICQGYARYKAELGEKSNMGYFDLLYTHILADSKHFNLNGGAAGLACTTLATWNPSTNSIVVGRNLDWMPFGECGEKSLLMVWKGSDRSVASFTIPGLIGIATGWNSSGMFAAMNVCPGETHDVQGMPALFQNRVILETFGTVSSIWRNEFKPLGPYHLTLADHRDAICMSFYQAANYGHYVRRVDYEDHNFLSVVNWRYPDCRGGTFSSEVRDEMLKKFVTSLSKSDVPRIDQDWNKIMPFLLSRSPYINSWITLHSIVVDMESRSISMKWDNGFAASCENEARLNLYDVFINK